MSNKDPFFSYENLEGLKLPKYVYGNYFLWSLIELKRIPLFYLLFAIATVDILWHSRKGGKPYLAFSCIIATLFVVEYNVFRTIEKSGEKLCEIVVTEAPGVNSKQWDIIAERMNDFLYSSGKWPSPHCVFEGEQCHFIFQSIVKDPGHYDLHDKDLVESAMRIYSTQFGAWWKEFLETRISNITEGIKDTLPRDNYRYRILWMFFHFMKVFGKVERCSAFTVVSSIFIGAGFVILFLLQVFGVAVSKLVAYCGSIGLIYGLFNQFTLFSRFPRTPLHVATLLATVATVKPHGSIEKWSLVAKYMNKCLDQGLLGSSQLTYFDGEHCRSTFEELTKSSGHSVYLLGGMQPFLRQAKQAAA